MMHNPDADAEREAFRAAGHPVEPTREELKREVARLRLMKNQPPPHPNASLENLRWLGAELNAARAEGRREFGEEVIRELRALADRMEATLPDAALDEGGE